MDERQIPPSVNMDPSKPIPGTITPKERFNYDVQQLARSRGDDKPNPKPNIPDPHAAKPKGAIMNAQKTEPKPEAHAEIGIPLPPSQTMEDRIQKQNEIKYGSKLELKPEALPDEPEVEVDEFTNIPDKIESTSKPVPPKPQKPTMLPNSPTSITGVGDMLVEVKKDEPVEEKPQVENVETTETVEIDKDSLKSDVEDPDIIEFEGGDRVVHKLDDSTRTFLDEIDKEETEENNEEASTGEAEENPEEEKSEWQKTLDTLYPEPNLDRNVAIAASAEGMTDGTLAVKINEDTKQLKIATGPKDFTDSDIPMLKESATQHFRIIEGYTNPALKKILGTKVTAQNAEFVTFQDDPKFTLKLQENEQYISEGERKVQAIAVQSGYMFMARPMTVRGFRSFQREIRSDGTYNYYMNVYKTLYKQLCEFSCGHMTFEDWINNTAYPDLETIIFAVYMATFPGKNPYTLTCEKCRREYNIFIENNTLVYIPTGSIWMSELQEVLNSRKDPKELVRESGAKKGRFIPIRSGVLQFKVKTPTIMEFLNNAFKDKKEEAIRSAATDMYYTGYIHSIEILDVKEFAKTGKKTFFTINDPKHIEWYIANLNPDEHQEFSNAMADFINRYSVIYQIPAVRCPHCDHIGTQEHINMQNLFFEVARRKDLLS